MDRLRVLIVDDEPPARAKARRFLADAPDIDVLGEAGDGPAAVEAITRLRPDLVLLDVQMPGMDGFGVLEALDAPDPPHVVFITAYDEYAVRAFEVHAVDYLLKPFDQERLRAALARARDRIGVDLPGTWTDRLRRAIEEARSATRFLDRILVRQGEAARLLRIDDVDRLEAEGNYVRVLAGGEAFLVRGTLAGFETRLDPGRFARIHRSHIVNLDRIHRLHPWSHGDWLVVLDDGTELMMSRRYRDRLLAAPG